MAKIDDALDAVVDFLNIKTVKGYYLTGYGKKSAEGLRQSIVSVLRKYGVELKEVKE